MDYNTFISYSLHPINFLSMIFPKVFGSNVYAPLYQFNATSGLDIELLIGAPCLVLLISGIFIKRNGAVFYYGAVVINPVLS